MFSILFENKNLRNNFHKYFAIKYKIINYNYISSNYTKDEIFDFEKCTYDHFDNIENDQFDLL